MVFPPDRSIATRPVRTHSRSPIHFRHRPPHEKLTLWPLPQTSGRDAYANRTVPSRTRRSVRRALGLRGRHLHQREREGHTGRTVLAHRRSLRGGASAGSGWRGPVAPSARVFASAGLVKASTERRPTRGGPSSTRHPAFKHRRGVAGRAPPLPLLVEHLLDHTRDPRIVQLAEPEERFLPHLGIAVLLRNLHQPIEGRRGP